MMDLSISLPLLRSFCLLFAIVALFGVGCKPTIVSNDTSMVSQKSSFDPNIWNTALWDTYTSEYFGINFSYPDGWQVLEQQVDDSYQIIRVVDASESLRLLLRYEKLQPEDQITYVCCMDRFYQISHTMMTPRGWKVAVHLAFHGSEEDRFILERRETTLEEREEIVTQGIAYLSNPSVRSQAISDEITVFQSFVRGMTSSTDVTSLSEDGWARYTADRAGFSFVYPDHWSVIDSYNTVFLGIEGREVLSIYMKDQNNMESVSITALAPSAIPYVFLNTEENERPMYSLGYDIPLTDGMVEISMPLRENSSISDTEMFEDRLHLFSNPQKRPAYIDEQYEFFTLFVDQIRVE